MFAVTILPWQISKFVLPYFVNFKTLKPKHFNQPNEKVLYVIACLLPLFNL